MTITNIGPVPADDIGIFITTSGSSYSFSTPGNALPCSGPFLAQQWSATFPGTVLGPTTWEGAGGITPGSLTVELAAHRADVNQATDPVMNVQMSANAIEQTPFQLPPNTYQ